MQLVVGNIVEGKVTGITKFGAFVDIGDGQTGMVHISEVASTYVKEIKDYLQENQMVKVRIMNITDDGKIGLSIRRAQEEAPPAPPRRPERRPQGRQGGHFNPNATDENLSFEDMLSKFKQRSEDKMSDIKRNNDSKRGGGRRR